MLLLRAILFYLGISIVLVIFTIIALLVSPLPYPQRYPIMIQWSHFALWWLKVTCRLDWRVSGIEHIPPGPAIIMCKHQSAWETLALQLVFPPQVWVLKRELLWIPFFGWSMAVLDPIGINRKATREALRQVIQQGTDRLKAGRWVVIFPEGTRVMPGEKRRYAAGGAILAAKTGYPVVPVAHNAGLFWPRNAIRKQPGTIDMVIGPVIQTKGKKAEEINAEAERWIEETSDELLGTDAKPSVVLTSTTITT